MLPNHVRNEFSAGTVHGPERLTSPTPRTPADCVATPTAAVAGRSEVSGTRSERITALAAASMRGRIATGRLYGGSNPRILCGARFPPLPAARLRRARGTFPV